MKVKYDKSVDAAYIQLSSNKPDGAVEIADELVAIEILDAAKKFPIKTLYKLELVPYAA
jgi:uncharacterized protein YuzE